MAHPTLHEIAEEQEIDLTPLIDCFLMLIIFFSCLEFRSLEAKLAVSLPKQVGLSRVALPPEEVLRLEIRCETFGTFRSRGLGSDAPSTGEASHPQRLEGHRVAYRFQGRSCATLETLREALQAAAKPLASSTRLPVVVEPGPGTTYADVAAVVDEALALGYQDLRFGGGRGRAR